MILTDTNILDAEIIEESSARGTMKIRGIFQRADEANNNNRIYTKSLLEREMGRLATSLVERRLMGELDHPQHDSVRLQNVSHLITNLKFNGNEMIGEAELLNTPAGLTAQALIRAGIKVGISSRGLGSVKEAMNGTKVVQEDFKLITWDLVADPSTHGAFPGLSESNTLMEETVRNTYDKAMGEKIFISLLRHKLNKN